MTRAQLAALEVDDGTLVTALRALDLEVEPYPCDDSTAACEARARALSRVLDAWITGALAPHGFPARALSGLDACAVGWRVIAGDAPAPAPWGELFSRDVSPDLAQLHPSPAVQAAALHQLHLAGWPQHGAPADRFAIVWAAALARTLALPLTPGTLRSLRSPGGLVDAILGAWLRGEGVFASSPPPPRR